MKENFVRKILLLIFLVAFMSPVFSFAQEKPVRIVTRQIGTSSYFYKVINLSQNAIKAFQLGYNYHQEGNENELLIESSAVEAPTGWEGYPVFLEESEYLHIHYRRLSDAYFIQPNSSIDGFVVHLPQPSDLMRQATFTAIYRGGTRISGKVEMDTSTPILFDGKGQRPSDVNTFLAYLRPTIAQTALPQGQTTYYLLIFYGKAILPETFKATLNGMDIKGLFNPKPDTSEAIKLNLKQGRNISAISVDGIRNDGKKTTDTDRLVFIVP